MQLHVARTVTPLLGKLSILLTPVEPPLLLQRSLFVMLSLNSNDAGLG